MLISLPWVNIKSDQVLFVLVLVLLLYSLSVYFIAADDDEMPQELLLGKNQLNELGSESAKIKAMGISSRVLYPEQIPYTYYLHYMGGI